MTAWTKPIATTSARIRAAAERMTSLLDALNELSRATGAEMKPGPVDMSLLADWVAAELQDAGAPSPGADRSPAPAACARATSACSS